MRKTIIRITAFVMALVLSLALAATALADYKTIPYGEQSNAVRKMQDKLKDKGYYRGAVDGKFGPATKAAVIKFQKSLGITADGKPGNKTLTALYEGKSAINQANNTQQKQLTKPENPRTLYYGCTGSRVKTLQRALRAAGVYKGAIDGVYGDLTYEAVKKYQSMRGLSDDGMAGVKTIASLNKLTRAGISISYVMDLGSKGDDVRSLKGYLVNQGYTFDSGNEYTDEVAAAVRDWQAANGKEVTGTITEAQYNDIILGKEDAE